jgi:5-methylcytosine-specific restriction endonuclease McrA
VNVELQPAPVDVRKPPIGAVLRLHPQGQRGICGWCGEAVTETTPVRGWLKYWHDACAAEMAIIEQPDAARRAVLARDKGICCDCGADWSDAVRFIPEFYVSKNRVDPEGMEPELYSPGPKPGTWVQLSHEYFDWSARREQRVRCPYVSLVAISLWHVDHKVPLWKVRHLPALQRIEFFKLANLITRCEPCHKIKTSKEAAERAHLNELASGKKPKQARKFGSRQMPCGRNSKWIKRLNGKPEKRDGESE